MHDKESATASAVAMGYARNNSVSENRVKKSFTKWQILFYMLVYMSSWEALMAGSGSIFINGGPRAVIWGHLLVVPLALAQVASMAEVAALLPSAGAQYHWVWVLLPPRNRYRTPITAYTAWLTWSSWIALLASISSVAANIIRALVQLWSPGFEWQGWYTVLVMFGFLFLVASVNVWVFWVVPLLETVAGILHIALLVIFVAVLLALQPHHSGDFIFFASADTGGWNNDYVSINLGILIVTWGFVGFDGGFHMGEDTKTADKSVKGTVWSIVVNGVMSFFFAAMLMLGYGNVARHMDSSYPVASIFLEATSSRSATTSLVLGHLIICTCAGVASAASTSRLTFSWARDGGLPSYFTHVDKGHKVPQRAVWLSSGLAAMLALLNLTNSYTAFGAILSLTTAGLYMSYMVVIACTLYARAYRPFNPNPAFSLGRWGLPVNLFALFGSLYLTVFHFFPINRPVTWTTMNYALPINAGAMLLATFWYFGLRCFGRRWEGPASKVIDNLYKDKSAKE